MTPIFNSRIASHLFFFSVIFFLSSCRQIEVFEKNTSFPKHEWKSQVAATGSFSISDTASYYNIYVVLRHTDAYKYNNIWLNIGLQAPGDSMYFQKVNLELGSDANGWEGSGMNDIWEVRKLITGEARRFKKAGIYQFNLMNIMRDDPLQHVLSAGLRVEKAN
jgi:gliding motility-associated lipoprotein GldH